MPTSKKVPKHLATGTRGRPVPPPVPPVPPRCTICEAELRQGFYRSLVWTADPSEFVKLCPPCAEHLEDYVHFLRRQHRRRVSACPV